MSFGLLTGNIVILYVLRLGGSSSFIGIISSFQYIALFFLLIGRMIIDRVGTQRLMGTCWTIRYLLMVPLLISPFVVLRGSTSSGLLLVVLSLGGFHIARGIGAASFNPILGIFASGKDRGAYLSRLQIISHSVAIGTGIATAIILGGTPPITRYAIFIGTGIIAGFIASFLTFKLPIPRSFHRRKGGALFPGIKKALKRRTFRKFILLCLLSALVIGMAIPFIIVYAKRVYHQPDGLIIVFTVLGSLGAISMGLISSLLMDRFGAKPIILLFLSIFIISLVLLIIAPRFSPIGIILFLGTVFFLFQLGITGHQNGTQNYFFSVIEEDEHLNLGILYNLVIGIGSTAGSLAGGFILDSIQGGFDFDITTSFRFYFGIIFALYILILILTSRLTDISNYTFLDALSVIRSTKQLRTVSLLNRLDRSTYYLDEVKAINALADSQSSIPIEDLLQRLKSPRFYIRSQSLLTLETLPINERVENALITEVKNHSFTTAYIAARIIGKKNIRKAIPALRQSLSTTDYQLQSAGILALGRLQDKESIPRIEKVLLKTKNPMVIIHGAAALELLGSVESLPVLFMVLKQKPTSSFLRDEVILSISEILGLGKWFYPFFTAFLEKATTGKEMLLEYLDEHFTEDQGIDQKSISHGVNSLLKKHSNRGTLVTDILTSGKVNSAYSIDPLVSAARDEELLRLERFCFLLSAVLVRSVTR